MLFIVFSWCKFLLHTQTNKTKLFIPQHHIGPNTCCMDNIEDLLSTQMGVCFMVLWKLPLLGQWVLTPSQMSINTSEAKLIKRVSFKIKEFDHLGTLLQSVPQMMPHDNGNPCKVHNLKDYTIGINFPTYLSHQLVGYLVLESF